MRRLAELVAALTGPKARVTGAVQQIEVDPGDAGADERMEPGETVSLWRRIAPDGGDAVSMCAP